MENNTIDFTQIKDDKLKESLITMLTTNKELPTFLVNHSEFIINNILNDNYKLNALRLLIQEIVLDTSDIRCDTQFKNTDLILSRTLVNNGMRILMDLDDYRIEQTLGGYTTDIDGFECLMAAVDGTILNIHAFKFACVLFYMITLYMRDILGEDTSIIDEASILENYMCIEFDLLYDGLYGDLEQMYDNLMDSLCTDEFIESHLIASKRTVMLELFRGFIYNILSQEINIFKLDQEFIQTNAVGRCVVDAEEYFDDEDEE